MSTVQVCWSRKDWTFRRIVHCPTCQKRRRWVGWAQEWYSTIWTCCGCGDSFGDGERMERPFKRGWRSEAIKRAKADWVAYGVVASFPSTEDRKQ